MLSESSIQLNWCKRHTVSTPRKLQANCVSKGTIVGTGPYYASVCVARWTYYASWLSQQDNILKRQCSKTKTKIKNEQMIVSVSVIFGIAAIIWPYIIAVQYTNIHIYTLRTCLCSIMVVGVSDGKIGPSPLFHIKFYSIKPFFSPKKGLYSATRRLVVGVKAFVIQPKSKVQMLSVFLLCVLNRQWI